MTRLVYGRYSPDPDLDPSVFRVIELSRRQLPLLQNLRHLAAYELEPHIMWNIPPFLGPKLSSFSLTSRFGEGTFESMFVLASLKTHSPSLEHLHVSGLDPSPSVVCGTVCSLKHLRSLSLCLSDIPLTAECIDHLSSLSNLTELTATITKDGLAHRASAAGREISFASLWILTIRTDSWVVANDFCEVYLRPSSLCILEISVIDVPSSRYIEELFTTLRRRCSVISLKSITLLLLSVEQVGDDALLDRILDPDALRPLFPFFNLEKLKIEGFMKVNDALADGMASAWPRLKS